MSTIDYKQVEEAYKYLPEPTRLFKLDRNAVLAAHADLNEREETLDAAGQVRTRRVIVGGGKHFSGLGIEELKPITSLDDEIRIDEIAKGSSPSLPQSNSLHYELTLRYPKEDCWSAGS
jgi:hypothetical protein